MDASIDGSKEDALFALESVLLAEEAMIRPSMVMAGPS
jgi:hypothetical protein